jgi:hypothetical protein
MVSSKSFEQIAVATAWRTLALRMLTGKQLVVRAAKPNGERGCSLPGIASASSTTLLWQGRHAEQRYSLTLARPTSFVHSFFLCR